MNDRLQSAAPHAFRLGPLEAQVMDVLWDHGSSTVREIINRLSTEFAYTTIATVLTNLDRKNLLDIIRTNRSTRYEPSVSRQQHAASLMEEVLAASKDRAASMLHFVQSMNSSDLDLLRAYLQEHDSPTRPPQGQNP